MNARISMKTAILVTGCSEDAIRGWMRNGWLRPVGYLPDATPLFHPEDIDDAKAIWLQKVDEDARQAMQESTEAAEKSSKDELNAALDGLLPPFLRLVESGAKLAETMRACGWGEHAAQAATQSWWEDMSKILVAQMREQAGVY